MIKEKQDNKLIFHDAELLATPFPNNVCCEINDDDITEDHYYTPEIRYVLKLPNQESNIIWHTTNGRFWMEGQISHPSKITINLCKLSS